MIAPAVLAGRARYERVMEGWTDNAHADALTHTVRLTEPERAVEVRMVVLPSPEYLVREARGTALAGDVDAAAVTAVARLAGVRMVGGLTRAAADAVGRGPGAALVVDAVVEIARLSRQVAKLPAEQAARAAGGDAWECWQLDMRGWVDLPDSCFAYSDAGRALFGARPIVTASHEALYRPPPGRERVFVRKKVGRVERAGGRLRLFQSMHDNVHGFELTFEIDEATGRIERAESVTSRLPYTGICSEPQAKIKALLGETVDAGLRKRLSAHVGGVTGCAQLFDLTADVLKLLG